MNPGRELDALIADEVMGSELVHCSNSDGENFRQVVENYEEPMCFFAHKVVANTWHIWLSEIPNYSTDIKAAWEVVEKIKELTIARDPRDKIPYCNEPWDTFATKLSNLHDEHFQHAFWDVNPHAICLAALKAKGIDV